MVASVISATAVLIAPRLSALQVLMSWALMVVLRAWIALVEVSVTTQLARVHVSRASMVSAANSRPPLYRLNCRYLVLLFCFIYLCHPALSNLKKLKVPRR